MHVKLSGSAYQHWSATFDRVRAQSLQNRTLAEHSLLYSRTQHF